MLNSSQSRKRHEQDGKEDFAGAQETRTIGSGLRVLDINILLWYVY